MLEIRPSCENCDKDLAPDATDAMICTYECTFCSDCVTDILNNVCPNCGGGFEKRPVRPKGQLGRNPAQETRLHKPIKPEEFKVLKKKWEGIAPEKR